MENNATDWPAGEYSVTLTVTDSGNKTSAPVTVKFVVTEGDTIAPAVPSATISTNGKLSFTTSDLDGYGVAGYELVFKPVPGGIGFTYDGQDYPADSEELTLSVPTPGITAASAAAAQTISNITLPVGEYTMELIVYDVAGNNTTVKLPTIDYVNEKLIGLAPTESYGAIGSSDGNGTIDIIEDMMTGGPTSYVSPNTSALTDKTRPEPDPGTTQVSITIPERPDEPANVKGVITSGTAGKLTNVADTMEYKDTEDTGAYTPVPDGSKEVAIPATEDDNYSVRYKAVPAQRFAGKVKTVSFGGSDGGTPSNLPPTVSDYTVKTDSGQSVTGAVYGHDEDGDTLTYKIGSDPKNGEVKLEEDGSWTYTPNEGSSGTDSFTVIVSDGQGGTAISTITISVAPESDSNFPPTVPNYTVKTDSGQSVTGAVYGYDADGDTLTYEIGSKPKNGEVTVDKQDGSWTYTPNEGSSSGTDSFTVIVSDGKGGTDISTITIIVAPESDSNFPPTVPNYTVKTEYEQSVTGAVYGHDADGDELTYKIDEINGNPKNGTVTVDSNGSWTYTPEEGFSGKDSFTVIVKDEHGSTANSIITIIVAAATPGPDPEPGVTCKIEMKASPNTIVADGNSTSTLTARVTDLDNNPVAGVTVEFAAEMGTFPGGSAAVTDSNGDASVVFKSDKIEDTIVRTIDVTATVQDKDKGLYGEDKITVTFEPSSITGIVTDSKGNPIKGAKVVVTNGDIGFSAEYVTGPDGKYKIFIPKGDLNYDIEITKSITLNGTPQEITFKQKARADEITGDKEEEFPAEKTFTGLILTKDKDGKDQIAGKGDAQGKIVIRQLSSGGPAKEGEVDPKTGIFSIEGLEKGKTYEFVILEEIDGKELIMGKMEVTLGADGEINIHEVLIDPYGTITDKNTGKVLGGVRVELFYADTPRNRAKGITPKTSVSLPAIPGFAPNNNANAQDSVATLVFNNHPSVKDHGNYAWMVYPEADYYIVATKEGYEIYTSPIISVESDVVKHDFAMTPKQNGGGGGGGSSMVTTPTQPEEELTPDKTPSDVAVELSSNQRAYLEGKEVEIEIKYADKKGNTKDVELVVTIPSGAVVKNPNGGIVEGNTIRWKLEDLKGGELGIKKLILELPEILSSEEILKLKAELRVNGITLDKASTLSITVFSNRFGNGYHLKYIYGYPDGEFKPDRSITRAEIAVIFARLLQLEGLIKNEQMYNDVELNNWHARGVEAATKKGLFKGYEGRNFRPDQPITRGELATVIGRFLELPNSPPIQISFKDTNNHWALNYMAELYRNNIISGYEDGTFKPELQLKRSEAVTIIDRMLNRGPLKGIGPSFPDVDKTHWASGHVEESSVSHEYYRNSDSSETYVKTLEEKLEI